MDLDAVKEAMNKPKICYLIGTRLYMKCEECPLSEPSDHQCREFKEANSTPTERRYHE